MKHPKPGTLAYERLRQVKKRKTCKPVKVWAVVEITSDKIDVDAMFLKRADAVAFHHEAERIVRVEIREIRRTKR